jgi:tetratricopeptide (TPR) repeat protein
MRLLLNTLFICFLFPIYLYAQDDWPSPEVAQMYRHAQNYMAMGNYKDAIITYRQAIVLAPAKFVLYKELGRALYLSGNFKDAAQVLQSSTEKPEADAECFQILSESLEQENELKKAHHALKTGLERFPASGMLYQASGKLLYDEKSPEAALNAWLDGISKKPAFAGNYCDAAKWYLAKDDVMWGLIYGEIYLDISGDSNSCDTMKKMLFAGYKKMFDKIADMTGTSKQKMTGTFESSIRDVYLSLTPVISDGITTENLTMVRTRFIMDWLSKYGKTYPFSLFSYQDYLLRNGLFDIYNEWLFGKAESMTEYKAWQEFHPEEMDIFLRKKKEHLLQPMAGDFYNER